MSARRIALGAVGTAFALTLASSDASALTIARITRHGYILVDEDNAANPYNGMAPVAQTQTTFEFLADLTTTLQTAGAPTGDYVAVMQTSFERSALAFYLGLVNDTLGIGQRSPLGGNRETFDLNSYAGTAFPLTGFVFLNNIEYYTDPGLESFGRTLICTQEFGHRYGTVIRIPPHPAVDMDHPGADAGPVDDVAPNDTGAPDDATTTDDAGAPDDVAVTDAGAPDADLGPTQASDALLGRQRAHWSYFVNSHGSPMEGNDWEELESGVFRTHAPSFRFSDLDLYIMGLAPASAVAPFYLIANPNVMGQRDQNGQTIFRESPPEYQGRTVTIRGTKVTYTIDDVIRANGPRVPAYSPDAGSAVGDGGAGAPADMNVIWVLLAQPDEVTPHLANTFDEAIESCTMGYNGATGDRSHLLPIVLPMPDAGQDAGADASADASAATDGATPDASAHDAGTADDGVAPRQVTVDGGCGACSTVPGRTSPSSRLASLMALFAAAALVRARRRTH